MGKHRKKSHHRKIATAAAVVAAMAVPSVAFAADWQGDWPGDGQSEDHRGGSPNPWETGSGRQWHQDRPAPTPSWTPSNRPASPSAAAAPSSPAPASPGAAGATSRVVSLVNSERSKAGCGPVTANAKLTKAAQAHSADMASHRQMSHTGSDGSSPGKRVSAAGYQAASWGENVAYGYGTPERVMAAWMSSPGHKRNILDCKFKEIGVGLAQPGDYWTQLLAQPRGGTAAPAKPAAPPAKPAAPAKPAKPAAPAKVTTAAQAAIAWAKLQLGKPYIWGGTGPAGFDCSGLTSQAWQHAGVTIPRVSQQQLTLPRVPMSAIQPGDLIIYSFDSYANHVTMYIGNGQQIESSGSRHGVVITNLAGRGGTVAGVVRPS